MTSLMNNFALPLLTIGGLCKRTPESWYQPNLCLVDSGRDHLKPQPPQPQRRQRQQLQLPLQQPLPDLL